jgi:trehalose 6-phosphate synthase/phosphatase
MRRPCGCRQSVTGASRGSGHSSQAALFVLQAAARISPDWMKRLRPILEQSTASTPGSRVENKSASIAWHYRAAKREFGARQGNELRMLLGGLQGNQPFEILEGKKVIEVRVRGISKGLVAQSVLAEMTAECSVLTIGDDRTDEDLFRELRPRVRQSPRETGRQARSIGWQSTEPSV